MLNLNEVFLLFEDRINQNRNFLFKNPIKKLTAKTKQEYKILYQEIEKYKKQNKYIAGYFPYNSAVIGEAQRLPPTAELYIFNEVTTLTNQELDDYFNTINKHSYIYDFKPNISKSEYIKKLKKLKNYIKDGETYQTNFTFKANFNFTENPLVLYKSLREKQLVEYGAFLNLENKSVISLSPELFVRKDGDELISKPMKGTLKRDNPDLDKENIKKMKDDKKMISENLMIVDLIRNDFTKISIPKSVKVENIFEVLKYKTLYQMISTVKSKIDKNIKFETVMEALFPCGSITGAPKIRTIQIINELEKEDRGVYTGAIGFIKPNNDFIFNIAIRTIMVLHVSHISHISHVERHGHASLSCNDYKASIGIGGGILYDSNNEDEWDEAILKSKFLRSLNDDLIILETIAKKDGKLEYEKEHLERLIQTANTFGIKINVGVGLVPTLDSIGNNNKNIRIRHVRVDPCIYPPHDNNNMDEHIGSSQLGSSQLGSSQLGESQQNLCLRHFDKLNVKQAQASIKISPIKINHHSIFRRYKTNKRELYNKEFEKLNNEFIDIIFFNQDGNLAEGSRNNIYIEINNKIYTPFIKDGALPGTIRQKLIDDNKVIEKTINMELFKKAEKIYISNSINGFIQVKT